MARRSDKLSAVCASNDSDTLRIVAGALASIGVEARTAATIDLAVAACEVESPDFLFVDADGLRAADLMGRVRSGKPFSAEVFAFHMSRRADGRELRAALEGGYEDFLALPPNACEIVARTRAAARVLEHDRRRGASPGADDETGLPNRAALAAAAHERVTAGATGRVVVGDIDFFTRIERRHGRRRAGDVQAALVDRLLDCCGDAMLLAVWDGQRFGVVATTGAAESESEWLARIQAEALGRPYEVDGEELPLTASFGSAPLAVDGWASVVHAEQALAMAKSRGRGQLVRYEDVVSLQALESAAAAGTASSTRLATGPFVAQTRHAMIPCPLVVRPDETIDQVARLMDQSGWERLPVVDRDGRLVGLIERDRFRGTSRPTPTDPTRDSAGLARGAMNPRPMTLPEELPLDEALAGMSVAGATIAVVTRDGRPCGLIGPDLVAALGTPLDARTFQSNTENRSRAAHPFVPEPCLSTPRS